MTKILIEIDTDTQRVVPVEPHVKLPELPINVAKGNLGVRYYDGIQMHQYAVKYMSSLLAAAPQPEPVDADLRRDAELWRAHHKRKQDLIDRGFLRNPLRAAPQACLAEIVTIDAAISQGE